jgi:hypothetical protein
MSGNRRSEEPLLAEKCRSDIGSLDQCRNENSIISTVLKADILVDQVMARV